MVDENSIAVAGDIDCCIWLEWIGHCVGGYSFPCVCRPGFRCLASTRMSVGVAPGCWPTARSSLQQRKQRGGLIPLGGVTFPRHTAILVHLEQRGLLWSRGLAGLLTEKREYVAPRMAASVDLDCAETWHSVS
jgi:hypothetical protein